ncbi:hypothetical protein IFM46972_10709, partial [Aspergillus udagawae]
SSRHRKPDPTYEVVAIIKSTSTLQSTSKPVNLSTDENQRLRHLICAIKGCQPRPLDTTQHLAVPAITHSTRHSNAVVLLFAARAGNPPTVAFFGCITTSSMDRTWQ